MSRKLHDGVEFSAKLIRLEKSRGLELPSERRYLLTQVRISSQKALTDPKVHLRDQVLWGFCHNCSLFS